MPPINATVILDFELESATMEPVVVKDEDEDGWSFGAQGAMIFSVTTILVYGMSIVFYIMSEMMRNPQHREKDIQVRDYIKKYGNSPPNSFKEEEQRIRAKLLQMSILGNATQQETVRNSRRNSRVAKNYKRRASRMVLPNINGCLLADNHSSITTTSTTNSNSSSDLVQSSITAAATAGLEEYQLVTLPSQEGNTSLEFADVESGDERTPLMMETAFDNDERSESTTGDKPEHSRQVSHRTSSSNPFPDSDIESPNEEIDEEEIKMIMSRRRNRSGTIAHRTEGIISARHEGFFPTRARSKEEFHPLVPDDKKSATDSDAIEPIEEMTQKEMDVIKARRRKRSGHSLPKIEPLNPHNEENSAASKIHTSRRKRSSHITPNSEELGMYADESHLLQDLSSNISEVEPNATRRSSSLASRQGLNQTSDKKRPSRHRAKHRKHITSVHIRSDPNQGVLPRNFSDSKLPSLIKNRGESTPTTPVSPLARPRFPHETEEKGSFKSRKTPRSNQNNTESPTDDHLAKAASAKNSFEDLRRKQKPKLSIRSQSFRYHSSKRPLVPRKGSLEMSARFRYGIEEVSEPIEDKQFIRSLACRRHDRQGRISTVCLTRDSDSGSSNDIILPAITLHREVIEDREEKPGDQGQLEGRQIEAKPTNQGQLRTRQFEDEPTNQGQLGHRQLEDNLRDQEQLDYRQSEAKENKQGQLITEEDSLDPQTSQTTGATNLSTVSKTEGLDVQDQPVLEKINPKRQRRSGLINVPFWKK